MRLIDADAFKNPYEGTSLEWQGMVFLKMLEDAPTIDALPIGIVADLFGAEPCNYTFAGVAVDEFMSDHCGEWCTANCDEVPMVECWRRFLEAWVERKDNDKN